MNKFLINFIKITCNANNKIYYDFQIIENNLNKLNGNDIDDNVSITVLGLNSVSHIKFIRHLHKTNDFLRNNLSSIEFYGHNKVGQDKYSNVIPILTGLDSTELNTACLSQSNKTYDSCSFLWNKYHNSNYKTIFIEDVSNSSIFHQNTATKSTNSFHNSPTDIYLKPLILEIEKILDSMQDEPDKDNLCSENIYQINLVMNLLDKLIPFYQKHQYFQFIWLTSMAEKFSRISTNYDFELLKLLKKFTEFNILQKTILILISDHGVQIENTKKTYQESMEERLPFLYIIVPKWFELKYSVAFKNLMNNAQKLTTNFDLYETLLDLRNLNLINNNNIEIRSNEILDINNIPRGISLFLPLPDRNCDIAGVPRASCTCLIAENLPTNDRKVLRAARYIVYLLNDKIHEYPKCRKLNLNAIFEAIIYLPQKVIQHEIIDEYATDIKIRIQTKPGMAEYTATVRITSFSLDLVSDIIRLNENSRHSYCIDNDTLRKYCYCLR